MRNMLAGKILVFKRRFSWVCLLAALCWGCQKTELPPDVKEQPVFSVSASNVVSIEAGVDYTYLFTDFIKDDHDVLTFRGKFASQFCKTDTCRGSVQFEFRNRLVGNDVFPGEVFQNGEYEYADQSNTQGNTIYAATFSVPDTTGFQSFFWNFNGTGSATGPVVQQEFQSAQPVRVSLTAVSNKLAVSTVSHLVPLTGSTEFPAVRIRVFPDSGKYLVQAVTTGPQVTDYHWQPDTTYPFPIITTTILNTFYAVTVTDNLGNTASAQVDGLVGMNQDYETPDFVSSVQTITTGDSLQLGKIAIQWIDYQGIIWRSDQKAQLPTAQFNVTASEAYELNENGQKTQKMTVTFKCTLYSPAGETMPFEGTGVIAVAY